MNIDRQYNIAVVAPSAPPLSAGGVANAHFNIHRCLQELDCSSTLLTFNESGVSCVEPGIIRFGAKRHIRSIMDFAVFCYLKVKRSNKPAYQLVDIINSIPGVLKINRHLRYLRPDVMIIPDHGAPGLFLLKKQAVIIMVAHHNPSRFACNSLLGEYCPLDAAKAIALEQRMLKQVDAVICPSAYMKRVFAETYRFGGEIEVIPNPVNDAFIDAIRVNDVRNELNVPQNTPVVYIPSAGSALKGARFVFEVVRRLATAYPERVGFYLSGEIGPMLQAELKHVPPNARIFMPGQVNYQDNIALIKSCSFGISPTLIENFSMALLEAGFCGVPMVTFAVGGNEELISEGDSGFVVPYFDMETLLAKAMKLFDADFCRAMHSKTLTSVRKRFNSTRIASRYLAFCERHLGKRKVAKNGWSR
jgi:glycosyltransferase involved in cell wall biosynthesis